MYVHVCTDARSGMHADAGTDEGVVICVNLAVEMGMGMFIKMHRRVYK